MNDLFCEFRKFNKPDEWRSYKNGPPYGELSRSYAPMQRCPRCNRRLIMKAMYCVGGEFVSWAIPRHKPRVTRRPGQRRKSRIAGRGK